MLPIQLLFACLVVAVLLPTAALVVAIRNIRRNKWTSGQAVIRLSRDEA